jgi:hypothetical protein
VPRLRAGSRHNFSEPPTSTRLRIRRGVVAPRVSLTQIASRTSAIAKMVVMIQSLGGLYVLRHQI